MNKLILITNDDGYAAKGIKTLVSVARQYGDVVVMAPEHNASGLSHSFTSSRPLRVRDITHEEGLDVYACDGTPVDCVKLAFEHFCSKRPDLVLSGINHGSNSAVNVLYSGTMGAVIEAAANGYNAIGFSLVNQYHDADFTRCEPTVSMLIDNVLQNGLPLHTSLNVNIPDLPYNQQKGIKICRAAQAHWSDSFEKRIDPHGTPYWWLTGKFICNDTNTNTDEYALHQGYVSVVPIHPDYTDYDAMPIIQQQLQ